MNDDALPPELELASAYLDGDVDDDQRAQVEASPELTAMVASFQQLRVSLSSTPAADPAVRDAAVVAALAEFDVLRATPVAAAVVAPPTNVVSIHRTRWSRVVMGAAAALLLGGVSVVAINSFGSSDDSASSGTIAVEKIAAADASADTAAGGGAGADSPPQTIGAINAAATPVPEVDEPAQLLALTAAATAPVESSADDTVAAGAPDTTVATAESAPDLTAAGSAETTATSIAAATATPRSSASLSFPFDCQLTPTQVILVEISWRGTPAVAVRDTVTGVIMAIDAQCNVLASAP